MRTLEPVLVLGLSLALATSTGLLAGQPVGTSWGGTVRSTLTLKAREVSVASVPGLHVDSDDAATRLLLSSSGSAARVRVGTLHSHPQLRLGELEGSDSWYDLWLTRTSASPSWTLEAQSAASDNDVAASANVVGTIPLSHETVVDPAVTLSVALVATGDDDGRLVLRWGHHRWSADFGFAKQPPPPRPERYERHGTFDEDPAERARALVLTARHETALTLPDDSRIAVLFGRSIGADHDDDDFTAIADMDDGEVLRLTKAAVIRLRTEVPLTFGAVAVPTDNWAPGFPGSYGLWVKRAGRAWTLVFNHEADSWGTQHDPQFDAAEIDVTYSQNVSSTYPLGVALIPTGEASGQLVIHWGPHVWTTDFTVG